MLALNENEKTMIYDMVKRTATVDGEAEQVHKKVVDSFTGKSEIYDQSVLDLPQVPCSVKGLRILEIGARGMVSTFDLLERGAESIHVFEPEPFGVPHWETKELRDIIRLKARKRGIDVGRLKLDKRAVGLDDPLILKRIFDMAYYFFPTVDLIRTFPYHQSHGHSALFQNIVRFVYNNLKKGGSFIVVSEVPIKHVNKPDVEGFGLEVSHKDGASLYDEDRLKENIVKDTMISIMPKRPASSLALTFLKYTRMS